jgi:hypothetical protein
MADTNDIKFARALLLAGGLLAPLVVAARLAPDARGFGTHQQLGLPTCSWPVVLGIPCPSCGMTTAFALMARADFGQAFRAQPLGALLALAAACGCIVAAGAAVSGFQLQRLFDPLVNRWGAAALVVVAALSWLWKVAVMREWFA